MKEFLIEQEEQLQQIANYLLALEHPSRVFLFVGDLGVGKTTLIKVLGKKLGVVDSMSSPSFSLINEYRTEEGESIYHFDCYRLEEIEEALEIGIEEYLESGNYCFIEWPEKISPLLAGNEIKISINLRARQRLIRIST